MKARPIEAGETFQEDRLSGSSGLAKAFPSLDEPRYSPTSGWIRARG